MLFIRMCQIIEKFKVLYKESIEAKYKLEEEFKRSIDEYVQSFYYKEKAYTCTCILTIYPCKH